MSTATTSDVLTSRALSTSARTTREKGLPCSSENPGVFVYLEIEIEGGHHVHSLGEALQGRAEGSGFFRTRFHKPD